MSYMILDFLISIFSSLDWLIQATFGKFMPDLLASYSFTLLMSTISAYCNRKHHPVIKYLIYGITGLYALYKIYAYQIAASLDTLTTVTIIFLFIVYPFGLLFTATWFKDWRIGDWKVFNFHTFWLIYLGCVIYIGITDPLAISLEFCFLYIAFAYVLVFIVGHIEEV